MGHVIGNVKMLCAPKVLKLRLNNQFINQLLQKSYQSIF